MYDSYYKKTSIWSIKNFIMGKIIRQPGLDILTIKEEALSRYSGYNRSIEQFFDETSFADPDKVEQFRQDFGSFLYQETGIKIPGWDNTGDCGTPPPPGKDLENIYRSHRQDIVARWNATHPKCLHIPNKLVEWLIWEELSRLRTSGGAGKENIEPAGRTAHTAVSRPAEPAAAGVTPEKSASGKEPVTPVPEPEEVLLERGRAWLADMHRLLGINDPVSTELARLREQLARMSDDIKRLEEENSSLKEHQARQREREKQIQSRWSHLEMLEQEKKRLEKELEQAREDVLADFFRELIEENPQVEEILLGQNTEADLHLAALVEFFRSQGLRPHLPGSRLGERVKITHQNKDYRPLDFVFNDDLEVEARIVHPGIAYQQRKLLLPGVSKVSPEDK